MLIQNASVCAFKTPPCVPGKRPHVLNMLAFSGYTRRRLESTHGGFSAFSVFLALSLPSVSPSFFLFFSPLLSSLFLSSLSCLLSLLSIAMTMFTRPVGSLCVHTAQTGQSVRVRGLRTIPCWPTCSHDARNNCPGMTMQASRHLE